MERPRLLCFLQDERGASIWEYTLPIVIGLSIVVILFVLGKYIVGKYIVGGAK